MARETREHRKYFNESAAQLRVWAESDLAGVRAELRHRHSRGARRLADELGNGTDLPVEHVPVAPDAPRAQRGTA